jgi:hypothetical protein
MRPADRSSINPTGRHRLRLALGVALGVAVAGCGGEPGSVHLNKPIDEKAIGAPPKSTTTSKPRPAASPKKKAQPFIPG